MIRILLTLAFIVGTVLCDCGSNPPDGTGTKLFFSECDTSTQHQLSIISVSVSNADGSPNYPINVTNPILLDVASYNSGPEIDNLVANVTLYAWTGVLSCGWVNVPTFGLLNNIAGCYNCPLAANSNVDLDVTVDLSAYSKIISGLLGGGVYALDVHLKTDPKNTQEIACVHVEAMIAK